MNRHIFIAHILFALAHIPRALVAPLTSITTWIVRITGNHQAYLPALWSLLLAARISARGTEILANQPNVNSLAVLPWFERGPLAQHYDTSRVVGWSNGWFVRQSVHHFPGDAPSRIREIALIAFWTHKRNRTRQPQGGRYERHLRG